jgi:Tfp pilus assembly protein PilN
MRAVNLIPNDQRRGASVGAGRSEGGAYAVLGLLAAVALLAFLYGHAKHQVTGRNNEIASLTAKAQSLKAEASSLAPYTSFVQMHESREQAVAALVNSRFDWAHAFHEFGRVIPRGVAISSLDGTVGAAASTTATAAAPAPTATTGASTATSATPPGSVPTFTIAGCATSQRTVAILLQRLRLIDGVDEVTLQSSTKGASGGGSGSCAAGPAFTLTVAFDALPAATEAAAAIKGKSATAAVADSSATGASAAATGASTPTTVGGPQ